MAVPAFLIKYFSFSLSNNVYNPNFISLHKNVSGFGATWSLVILLTPSRNKYKYVMLALCFTIMQDFKQLHVHHMVLGLCRPALVIIET